MTTDCPSDLSASQQDSIRPSDEQARFVQAVIGPLRKCDADAVAAALQANYDESQLIAFLGSAWDDCAKIAATCLGVTGTMSASEPLARALHHDDAIVVAMAEHALWSIWFRAAGLSNEQSLKQVVILNEGNQHEAALAILDEMIERNPTFAEAYNLRAVVHYSSGSFERAMADCRRATKLCPEHFGAWASVGHCLVQLGNRPAALVAYDCALQIHPRMRGIRQLIRTLRQSDSLSHSA